MNIVHPRHALVTGTSSGIGAAIAARLLAGGWRVSGVARRKTAFSGDYHAITADLATPEGCANTIVAAQAAAGPVTALVHAAGFLATSPLGALDAEAGQKMWQVHVSAAERLANALIPGMTPGGRVVLIGSRTATGSAERSQYAASKAALVAMARSWAIECASRGITVNVVAPAATDTPMLSDPARNGVVPKLPPIGRFIHPEEVAAATAFLLSEEAAAITGQTLTICGGASL